MFQLVPLPGKHTDPDESPSRMLSWIVGWFGYELRDPLEFSGSDVDYIQRRSKVIVAQEQKWAENPAQVFYIDIPDEDEDNGPDIRELAP